MEKSDGEGKRDRKKRKNRRLSSGKRSLKESLRSRWYTDDNDIRTLQIRTMPAENSWNHLMDENEGRKLQGKKALNMRRISESRVSESRMKRDDYCYQTKSLNNPPTIKKSNVQNQPENV